MKWTFHWWPESAETDPTGPVTGMLDLDEDSTEWNCYYEGKLIGEIRDTDNTTIGLQTFNGVMYWDHSEDEDGALIKAVEKMYADLGVEEIHMYSHWDNPRNPESPRYKYG